MRLRNRIASVGSNHAQAQAGYTYHPAGTAATPMVLPTWELRYIADPLYPWGTGIYQTLQPRWSPSRTGGEYTLRPARDSGQLPQLRPAGRP